MDIQDKNVTVQVSAVELKAMSMENRSLKEEVLRLRMLTAYTVAKIGGCVSMPDNEAVQFAGGLQVSRDTDKKTTNFHLVLPKGTPYIRLGDEFSQLHREKDGVEQVLATWRVIAKEPTGSVVMTVNPGDASDIEFAIVKESELFTNKENWKHVPQEVPTLEDIQEQAEKPRIIH